MDWDPAEVPEDVMRDRIALLAAACCDLDVDALLYYTSFPRPAQVSALTHFVPFWSQALLVVTKSGSSMLAMATTGRTVQWIKRVSLVDEVIVGTEIGASAGQWLYAQTQARRVAIASPDDLPQSAYEGLCRALPGAAFVETGSWWQEFEERFGPTPYVSRTAMEIAESALALVCSVVWRDANALVAALDGHCRAHGAEEVSVKVAPDLLRDPTPYRVEGLLNLASNFGVRITLAYKGSWLRSGSSFVSDGQTTVEHPGCVDALRALRASALCTRNISSLVESIQVASGARVPDWNVEGRRGGLPLATLNTCDIALCDVAPSFASFSARIEPSGTPLIFSTAL